MFISSKRVTLVVLVSLFGFGLCRAALSRFQEKEQAILKACREELQKLGLTRGAAKAKYPTPEIHMASSGCLLPGETGEVVVKGKFAPGTKFVFENDSIEVLKESLAAGEYRATVKVPPGSGPQTAAVMAITPVTGISARRENAVVVGGKYEWTMDSVNGWRIVARPAGNTGCGERSSGEYPYEMSFFRKGETNPFEKRSATLHFSVYETTNYRFSISRQDTSVPGGPEDMQKTMQKLMDPKITDAQREQIMKSLEKMQAQMTANISKMSDPSYVAELEKKQQEFGCERIEAAVQGGAFKGEMRCSDKVGHRLGVTGTVKFLGR